MVDHQLFEVENGKLGSAYQCAIPNYLWELGLGVSVVIWLLGIRSIAKRRHWRAAATKPVVTAMAS
jgi:hypothetical protein